MQETSGASDTANDGDIDLFADLPRPEDTLTTPFPAQQVVNEGAVSFTSRPGDDTTPGVELSDSAVHSEPTKEEIEKAVSSSEIHAEWSEGELHIYNDYGSLLAKYDPRLQDLDIMRGDVTPKYRRHGVFGKLLERSLIEAKSVHARTITAAIVSRESLDSFTRFFGSDSVTVHQLGDYENPDPKFQKQETMASLRYTIEADQ